MLRISLPIAQPTLPAPKMGASPLPASKKLGNPSEILRASGPNTPARFVKPTRPLTAPIALSFEKTYEDEKKIDPNPFVRADARRKVEQIDRTLRVRASVVGFPHGSGRTGMDWIKRGRLIAPNAPGGMRGLVRAVDNPKVNGSQADAARVPAGTLSKIAANAVKAESFAPSLPPRPEPFGVAVPAPDGESAVNPTLYLLAAVGVVFGVLVLGRS